MNVQVVIDSAADLPKKYYEELALEVVPLAVHLNGEEFIDNVTIDPKTIYDAMREGAAPKTSQVTPEAFYEVFKKYTEKKIPIVYIGFSSGLSGTYQSAVIAKQQIDEEFPDNEIYLIDTLAASMGYGLIAYHVAMAAKDGATVQDLLDLANFYIKHMEHIFTVDKLEYLQRGGRVSKTQAFGGGLLNIKPLLHVEDGKLVPLEKIRGSKRVLSRMVEVAKERGQDFENQTLSITHGDDLETAEKLADLLRQELNPKDIIITDVGAVIGAHSGPGTIALFFLNETRN